MTQSSVYVAYLHPDDYAQFRKRDPSLPVYYSAWLDEFDARRQLLRRRGAIVVDYAIRFDDFAQRNRHLGLESFGAAARDDYAAEQAAIEILSPL